MSVFAIPEVTERFLTIFPMSLKVGKNMRLLEKMVQGKAPC